MNAAIAGLIGAAIGALASILGTVVTQFLQARATARNRLRDKKEEAYSNTLRYLLRVQNKRSEMSVKGGQLTTILGEDDVKVWFDDVIEAQFWVTSLSVYCSPSYRNKILDNSSQMNQAVKEFLSEGGSMPIKSFERAYDEIADCAKGDIGT